MNDVHDITTARGYLLGLDLGERVDYTALSVLREHRVPTGRTTQVPVGFTLDSGTEYEARPELESEYDVIYLDRWRQRGYKIAVPILAELLQELRQDTQRQRTAAGIEEAADLPATILVDHTGVGVSVLEDLRAAGLQCVGITFTSGTTVNRRGRDYLVDRVQPPGAGGEPADPSPGRVAVGRCAGGGDAEREEHDEADDRP